MVTVAYIGIGIGLLLALCPTQTAHLLNTLFKKPHPPCCSCRGGACEQDGAFGTCPCWKREG